MLRATTRSISPLPSIGALSFGATTSIVRGYAAKPHNKKHNQAAGGAGKDPVATAADFDLAKFTTRMEKSLLKFQEQLGALRLGRASTGRCTDVSFLGGLTLICAYRTNTHPTRPLVALLDSVRVTLQDGSAHKLSQLGQVVIKDPQTLHVVLADGPVSISPGCDVRSPCHLLSYWVSFTGCLFCWISLPPDNSPTG